MVASLCVCFVLSRGRAPVDAVRRGWVVQQGGRPFPLSDLQSGARRLMVRWHGCWWTLAGCWPLDCWWCCWWWCSSWWTCSLLAVLDVLRQLQRPSCDVPSRSLPPQPSSIKVPASVCFVPYFLTLIRKYKAAESLNHVRIVTNVVSVRWFCL